MLKLKNDRNVCCCENGSYRQTLHTLSWASIIRSISTLMGGTVPICRMGPSPGLHIQWSISNKFSLLSKFELAKYVENALSFVTRPFDPGELSPSRLVSCRVVLSLLPVACRGVWSFPHRRGRGWGCASRGCRTGPWSSSSDRPFWGRQSFPGLLFFIWTNAT